MSGHLRLAEPREEPGFQGSAVPGRQRERWDNGNGSGWGCRRVHSPGWGQFQRDRKCQAPLAVAEASPRFGGCLQLEGQQISGMRSHFSMALELLPCSAITSISSRACLGEGNIPFIPCHTSGCGSSASGWDPQEDPSGCSFPALLLHSQLPARFFLSLTRLFLGNLTATSQAAALPRQLVAAAVPYLRAHDFITSPSPHSQVLLVPYPSHVLLLLYP